MPKNVTLCLRGFLVHQNMFSLTIMKYFELLFESCNLENWLVTLILISFMDKSKIHLYQVALTMTTH